jgi:hypothetical protein
MDGTWCYGEALKVSSYAPIPRSHRNPHSIHRNPHLILRHSHPVHRHSHPVHRHSHPVHRHSHSIHRRSHSIQLQPLDPMTNTTRPNRKHHPTQLQPSSDPFATTPHAKRHLSQQQKSPSQRANYQPARVTCNSMYTSPIFPCQVDQLRRLTGRVYPTTCGLMHYKPCLPSNHRPSAFRAWSSITQLTR